MLDRLRNFCGFCEGLVNGGGLMRDLRKLLRSIVIGEKGMLEISGHVGSST